MALPFTGPQVTFEIVQGAQFVWGAVYGTTNNNVTPIVVAPFDFTGMTATGKIRTEPGGPLLLDLSSYIALNQGATVGRIQITIPANITAAVKESGNYDILINPGSSAQSFMLLQGAVNLTPANTT